MGKVMSVAVRKAKRFNVENRAHNFLEKTKEKPIVAPKFESNLRDLDRVLNENPGIVETLNKKNLELDDRLKKVYVTSTNHRIDEKASESTKLLPQDRNAVEDFEYGHLEPDKISRGHTTLRSALEFITKHQSEPKIWTAQRIAGEYKLKENVVENVLKYFHTFEVFIPENKSNKNDNILINSSTFRDRLTTIEKQTSSIKTELPPTQSDSRDKSLDPPESLMK